MADTLTPTASAVFLIGDEVKSLDAMQKFFDGIRQQLGSGSRYTVQVNPDDTQFFGDFALAHCTSHSIHSTTPSSPPRRASN